MRYEKRQNRKIASTHTALQAITGLPSRIFVWILGGLSLSGVTPGLVILLGVGKWVVREDTLEQATAIAVLSGNTRICALEAARLYHQDQVAYTCGSLLYRLYGGVNARSGHRTVLEVSSIVATGSP